MEAVVDDADQALFEEHGQGCGRRLAGDRVLGRCGGLSNPGGAFVGIH